MNFSFDQVIQAFKAKKVRKKCAVVIAESRHTLEAVLTAYREGIIDPLLIGEEKAIRALLEEMAGGTEGFTIIPAGGPDEAVEKAAALVHERKADLIMKGGIETWTLMRAALSKKSGLVTGKIVSGFNVIEFATYHKPLAYTDGGITLYPSLEQKKLILENAVLAFKKYGLLMPKVAALAAVEVVDPRIPETVDAYELKKMNERGEIKDCIVEGPITYDIAVSHEAARAKGFESPVAGDTDLLLFPDITSANIAMKALNFSGRTKGGFFTVGTKVPIIMTSRANSSEEKYLSIAFAASGDWWREEE
jgi:phosphate butyryltransferase